VTVSFDAAQEWFIATWVVTHLGSPAHKTAEDFGQFRAAGVSVDGMLVAGVVYHSWQPVYSHCEMTIYASSPRWATRGNIRALLQYPFDAGCRRITATAGHRNDRSIRMLKRLGFVQEGVARHGFGDQHCVIFGLLRKDFDKWQARAFKR
jgi:RimJ/RimL family protein N-acetyltransferase